MNKKKILITSTSLQDSPGRHHDELKKQEWEIHFLRGPLKEKDLLPIIHLFEGIICGDDYYTKKVLKEASCLKAISKYGVGLDRIDLDYAKKKKIKVTNCPGINQKSVAEHILALLFTFEKNIHLQHNYTQNKKWERSIGREIGGKTIGILGLGSVGKELAKKSLSLDLDVVGYDIFIKKNPFKGNENFRQTNKIEDLFDSSDYISLNLPLNKTTSKIVNDRILLEKTKKVPLIINTSRGGLVDSSAIINALKQKKIRGYLTDVLENEPIELKEELLGIENIIITPHIGSRTEENIEKQALTAISNLNESLR